MSPVRPRAHASYWLKILVLGVVFVLLGAAPMAAAQDGGETPVAPEGGDGGEAPTNEGDPGPTDSGNPTGEDATGEDSTGEDGTGEDGTAPDGGTDIDTGSGDGPVDPDVPPPPPPCPPGLINAAGPADPVRCVDPEEIARLLAEYEAAAAEETEKLLELSDILTRLDELNAQLDALRLELGSTQLQQAAASTDSRFAELRAGATNELLGEVQEHLGQQEDILRDQAVAAYVGGGTLEAGVTNALLDAESLSDVHIAREYSAAVLGNQLSTLDTVNALKGEVETLTQAVAEVEDLAANEILRVDELNERVTMLLDAQKSLVEASEEEATAVAQVIADIQLEKQAYADELQISAAGGGEIGDLLRQVQADQTPPDVVAGILAMPIDPTLFGSPFGPRIHPIFGGTRMHTGIDFSGGSGQQILSSADGLVVVAEEVGGYGNVVVVEHGNGLATLYAHMTAIGVTVGNEVETGDLLGFVGSTGFSTGPHLHYEVRLFGMPVDPMPYLDLTGFDETAFDDSVHSDEDDDAAGEGE